MFSKKIYFLVFSFIFLFSCSSDDSYFFETPQFELLKKDQTNLDFKNEVEASFELNVFNYMYFFNGGGVASGDFNQDGLVDLFFTSNMNSNKLFLNEGNLKFKDVTQKAKMEGLEGWTSGTSVVDINNDGLLDIYVCQVSNYRYLKGHNQLYINQGNENGIPVFKEEAAKYGLDFQGFGTQASFFDYDLDGDLDCYLLNHSLHQNGTFGRRKTFVETHPTAGDRLLKNENGTFVDVTAEAGIFSTVIGYGLGITTGDINLDGYPDIYIGNDFHENDYLYLNQKDGTFKEVLAQQINHTSRFSMGVDMADINNDGYNEIFSLDMLPADPVILKSSLGEDGLNEYNFKIGHGYHHQFARNSLQLNNGDGSFSEIAMFADVFATDWSWGTLFLDFDHDGYRDIFISNGIPRRMNDIDYFNFRQNSPIDYKSADEKLDSADLKIVERMPQIKLRNKFFKNNVSNLTFADIENQIKNDATSYSNGATYADLDNDGDLDIVVNNFEDEPFIYKNLNKKDSTQNYLSLELNGSEKNKNAIGARAIIFKGREKIIYEHFPVRGYQSSVDLGLHIGIGDAAEVDSVFLIWSDRTFEKIENIKFNQTQSISWKANLPLFDFSTLQKKYNSGSFTDITESTKIDFVHEENPFLDFNRETLIPHMVSSEGPAVAVGDINGDGLEDVFFGSSKRRKSQLYFQQPDGSFYNNTSTNILTDSVYEDVDAVFVDIEKDGDLDLVIASGGNEYRLNGKETLQRFYLNDGNGNFSEKQFFPKSNCTASCVLPADFDGDGLVDFFFGARAVPWKYGEVPTSFLFKNLGNGKFENVTSKYSNGLEKVGFVKNGSWADMDSDGDLDLLLAMEWDAIQFFENQGNSFKKKAINSDKGWWNFVYPFDFDMDGDLDFVAGNLGLNSRFKNATKGEPVRLYIEDFDDNKSLDQILTFYLEGREIPFANYAELTKQLVSLKKKFLLSKNMAKANLDEIFDKDKLESATVLEANTFESMYFENTPEGFKAHPLPDEIQFSTLNAATYFPKEQLLVAGNFFDNNIEMGKYDASYGNILSVGNNRKISYAGSISNIKIKGQVRRIKEIIIAGKRCYIFAKNNAAPQIIR